MTLEERIQGLPALKVLPRCTFQQGPGHDRWPKPAWWSATGNTTTTTTLAPLRPGLSTA